MIFFLLPSCLFCSEYSFASVYQNGDISLSLCFAPPLWSPCIIKTDPPSYVRSSTILMRLHPLMLWESVYGYWVNIVTLEMSRWVRGCMCLHGPWGSAYADPVCQPRYILPCILISSSTLPCFLWDCWILMSLWKSPLFRWIEFESIIMNFLLWIKYYIFFNSRCHNKLL